MSSGMRLTLLAIGAAAVSACASMPLGGDDGGYSDNFALGSRLSDDLNGADRAALEEAFLAAMETGAPQRWNGRSAVGEVDPGGYSIANLKADPAERIPAARGDFDLASTLETDLGLYVLTRNSNVRTGPGTGHAIADTFSSGDGVDVVGRVADGNWMLVAVDGEVRGYVYEKLMIKAPGTELALAGGPRRAPRLCRSFTQKISRYSEGDIWTGAACRVDGEWRLAPPAPGEGGGPQLLLTD